MTANKGRDVVQLEACKCVSPNIAVGVGTRCYYGPTVAPKTIAPRALKNYFGALGVESPHSGAMLLFVAVPSVCFHNR